MINAPCNRVFINTKLPITINWISRYTTENIQYGMYMTLELIRF